MIKAFLFDLDGVIVDTAVFHYRAWRKMANGLGFDISAEFDEKLKGVSRMESLDIILKHGGLELSEAQKNDLAKQKNDNYLEVVSQMKPDAILPGISEFFEQIKEHNSQISNLESRIYIALGSVSKNAKMILERINLLNEFDAIIDGNKIQKGKPDPEVFLNGAKELGVNANECIVLEDAVAGVQAGKNANMVVVGLGNSEILTKADLVLPSLVGVKLEELLAKFNKL